MALVGNIPGNQAYTPQPVGARLLQWVSDQVEHGVDAVRDSFEPTTAAVAPAGGALPGNKADEFIRQAMRFMGQPYRWGGGHGGTMSAPGPVDCSGLVQQAARLAGVNLDGTAASQQKKGRAVSMNDLQPGDLVFHGNPASHVGIYIGNGKVIHAPHTGDHVKIVDLATYHYFTSARRVFDAPGSVAPDPVRPAPAPAPSQPYLPQPYTPGTSPYPTYPNPAYQYPPYQPYQPAPYQPTGYNPYVPSLPPSPPPPPLAPPPVPPVPPPPPPPPPPPIAPVPGVPGGYGYQPAYQPVAYQQPYAPAYSPAYQQLAPAVQQQVTMLQQQLAMIQQQIQALIGYRA